MSEAETLETIEAFLKEEEFDCSLEPDEKAPPFGRVLVFLGHDSLDRERILEITAQHQELGNSPLSFTRIQFEIPLPFNVREEAANEVASTLAFLNRTLELPGFELDEINSKVYYRTVHLYPSAQLEKTILLGIVGIILMLLEIFSENIEQVCEGKVTFNQILNQMLQLAKEQ